MKEDTNVVNFIQLCLQGFDKQVFSKDEIMLIVKACINTSIDMPISPVNRIQLIYQMYDKGLVDTFSVNTVLHHYMPEELKKVLA